VANLVVLDSQDHRNLRVVPRPTRECAGFNVVSVIPLEFPRLLAHYPIFFTRAHRVAASNGGCAGFRAPREPVFRQ